MADEDPLTNMDCRYIIGELDGDWRYCRKPRAREKSGALARFKWCDVHYAICVVRGGRTKLDSPTRTDIRRAARQRAREKMADNEDLLLSMESAA